MDAIERVAPKHVVVPDFIVGHPDLVRGRDLDTFLWLEWHRVAVGYIPGDLELAAAYGISVRTLRRSLDRLEAIGAIRRDGSAFELAGLDPLPLASKAA